MCSFSDQACIWAVNLVSHVASSLAILASVASMDFPVIAFAMGRLRFLYVSRYEMMVASSASDLISSLDISFLKGSDII